jgi:hypothetical protein
MAKKATLTVTFPDGTIGKRTTERNYTHVVAGIRYYSDGTQKWVAWNWCSSELLARKQKPVSGIILEVNHPTKPADILVNIVEPPIPDDATELIPVVWTPDDEVSRLLDKLTENLLQLDISGDPMNLVTQDIPMFIFETGLIYDQPQPFNFRRGDVVEFKMAFPSHKLLEGVWLRGTFYNVYPGDPRYACIRNCGLPEAARLADIRYPQVKAVDIFDGKGEFEIKLSLDELRARRAFAA